MIEKIRQRLLDLKAEQGADTPMHCPRCGANTMKQPLSTNALSRIADVYMMPPSNGRQVIDSYANCFT